MSNDDEDEPNSPRADATTSEDDLAAMMAFQEQQIDDQIHQDDPNIVFLHDEEEEAPHPNHNNPAAVALRARLEQHRLRANQPVVHPSLLRRITHGVPYSTWSFLSAFYLIFHTMRTRQQFYLTVMYLQSSKLSYIVLGNAIIAFGVCTFSFVTRLFLDGGLRVNERDAIGEHIRWDVTETCLALTIFRSEMDVGTAIMFLGLVIMKW
jgi:E3 ubiquitin-protein ligase synoviolin